MAAAAADAAAISYIMNINEQGWQGEGMMGRRRGAAPAGWSGWVVGAGAVPLPHPGIPDLDR